MQILKNITTGFLISFLGSFPLGYLNIVGLQLYSGNGVWSLIYFLTGIVVIEMVVVAATLNGAIWLMSKKKLLFVLEVVSVVIMLVFAFSFFTNAHNNHSATSGNVNVGYTLNPFILGMSLSALNFFQVPFWTSWNLVLVNTNRISTNNGLKYFYVLGTGAGTISGMIAFVFAINFIVQQTSFSNVIISSIFPLLFVAIAVWQIFKMIKKYSPLKKIAIQ